MTGKVIRDWRRENNLTQKRLAEEAVRHFESGFSLMKVKLGYGLEDDLAVMGEVRRALAGRPVTLMVDTNHAYGRAEALRLGRALEEYDLRWYEEPVAPEKLTETLAIRRGIRQEMAGGEFLFGVKGFEPLCREYAVGVIMPDVKHCGGMLEMTRIAAMADVIGVLAAIAAAWSSG